MKEESQFVSVAQVNALEADDSIDFVELLGVLWKNRILVASLTFVGFIVGVFLAQWVRPQYTSDAMLQLDTKGNKAGALMGSVGEIFETASPADAEIELLKSRMVLGYVVGAEHLCYSAVPVSALDRLFGIEGRMDLAYLQIPEASLAMKEKWYAIATGPDSYTIMKSDGKPLLKGQVGERLWLPYAGDTLEVEVKLMMAEPGQKFALNQVSPLVAVRDLANVLNVSEKGKKTGVLALTYSHRYSDRAAGILNTIAETYLRQNVEMRSAEAEKTLKFLEEQLPGVKAKLDTAEKHLADYRYKVGSVDVQGETRVHLDKVTELQRNLLLLEQQRQEATRLFKEEHPTVQTLVKQQARIRAELKKLSVSTEKMPITQQEIFTLQSDVELNNTLYTNMLNNIQQLRVVRAGEIGNVRIVDRALQEELPSKPKKKLIVLGGMAGGFVLALSVIFILRMFRRGVSSSMELEKETDISVYAKIPESKTEASICRKNKERRKKGVRPECITASSPDDLVCDAFRSLLTAVDFSQNDNRHKVVMVGGLRPGIGKSFVSVNLAAVYAQSGRRVLLIDCDMRRGTLWPSTKPGLADLLGGELSMTDVTYANSIPGMFTIPSGKSPLYPSELLRSGNFDHLIDQAKKLYDVVIVDTPPLSMMTDAVLVYSRVDMALMVIRYGEHTMDEIKEGVKTLKRTADKPLAFVMNRTEHSYTYGKYYYNKK